MPLPSFIKQKVSFLRHIFASYHLGCYFFSPYLWLTLKLPPATHSIEKTSNLIWVLI